MHGQAVPDDAARARELNASVNRQAGCLCLAMSVALEFAALLSAAAGQWALWLALAPIPVALLVALPMGLAGGIANSWLVARWLLARPEDFVGSVYTTHAESLCHIWRPFSRASRGQGWSGICLGLAPSCCVVVVVGVCSIAQPTSVLGALGFAATSAFAGFGASYLADSLVWTSLGRRWAALDEERIWHTMTAGGYLWTWYAGWIASCQFGGHHTQCDD